MDAINRVSNGVLRTALLLQHFAITFARVLMEYLHGVGRVARRIFIDFLVPLGSLCMVAVLLAMLSEHTGAYILGRAQGKLVFLEPWIRTSWLMIPALFVMVFCLQMLFLSAITKFEWRALARCSFLLVLWIAPFFFAFFVFISFSLIATGAVLRRWDAEFPYRLGPFTIGATAILAALIAYAVIHNLRHRVPVAQPAGPEVSSAGTEIPVDTDDAASGKSAVG